MSSACLQSGSRPRVQVAIVGAGPAGSVAAARLAQLGVSTTIIERERFPRFRIGESLLPNGNALLKKIGAWEKIQSAGFVEKRGAQFTLPDRSQTARNVFAHGLVPGLESTYHVERSRFDEILLRHAQSLGVEALEETAVTRVERDSQGWRLELKGLAGISGLDADWVIDASGRNSIVGRRLRLPREPLPYPGRLAIFNHFEGAERDPDERQGDIIVLRLQDAWFWSIPISASTTSVGVILQETDGKRRGESLEECFWRKVRESPAMTRALRHAKSVGPYRAESDYSFSHTSFGAERALLVGDAASFIDPVFSSGVYLAMDSGIMAAESIARCIARPATEARIYARYTRELKRRISCVRTLIDAYYDPQAIDVFISPRPQFQVARAINAILAGCLNPPFSVRWRLWLFKRIVALHKRLPLVPKIDWERFKASETPKTDRLEPIDSGAFECGPPEDSAPILPTAAGGSG